MNGGFLCKNLLLPREFFAAPVPHYHILLGHFQGYACRARVYLETLFFYFVSDSLRDFLCCSFLLGIARLLIGVTSQLHLQNQLLNHSYRDSPGHIHAGLILPRETIEVILFLIPYIFYMYFIDKGKFNYYIFQPFIVFNIFPKNHLPGKYF